MKKIFYIIFLIFLTSLAAFGKDKFPQYGIEVIRDIVYEREVGYWSENLHSEKDMQAQFALKKQAKKEGPSEIELKMDVYRPLLDKTSRRPLVILMHGGAFFMNHKRSAPVAQLAEHFASLGFIAVSFDYRMGYRLKKNDIDRAKDEALEDFRTVLDFLIEHSDQYNINPDHIVIGGASSGAITALRLAFSENPPKIDGVINMWGSVDDLSILERSGVPMISFHGTDDNVIPFKKGYPVGGPAFGDKCYGSFLIHEERIKHGHKSELVVFNGFGHAPYRNKKDFSFNSNYDVIRRRISEFLLDLPR